MAIFTIDGEIREWFDHYRNFCEFMAETDYESSFEEGLSPEEIEEWEQENDTELPHQYKSWLMLTGSADILSGELELFAPEIGSLEDADDIVIIAAAADGSEAGIRRKDGSVYSISDGEIRDFKDFDEFLTYRMAFLEDIAEDEMGDDWQERFDEMFVDNEE